MPLASTIFQEPASSTKVIIIILYRFSLYRLNRAAAAMNMEGVHERDIIGLKLSAEDLKAAQAESLATELESPATAREALASD